MTTTCKHEARTGEACRYDCDVSWGYPAEEVPDGVQGELDLAGAPRGSGSPA